MLPGLGHMILLGHIITKLEEDDDLTIVLDSPSSGHALTMFESPTNFKEMFRSGLIVEDIHRMERFIFNKDIMKVVVASLPTQMALQEAYDLSGALKERGIEEVHHVLNDALPLSPSLEGIQEEDFPDFLKKKVALEAELISSLPSDEGWFIAPHYAHMTGPSVVKDLSLTLNKEAL